MENYHDIDLKKIGARIRDARKAKKLTQEKAAALVSISSQFWSLVETGTQRAAATTYQRIADTLEVTLDDLFYDNATNIRLRKVYSSEELLADCTDFERAIISQSMLALKNILKLNRSL